MARSFSRPDRRNGARVQELRARLEPFLTMDRQALHEARDALDSALDLLLTEVQRVKERSNGYPQGFIAADVWLDGASLGELGRTVAECLADKGMAEAQEKATRAWTNAVLAVCSHYHHLVGPAMIASARINERLGNLSFAKMAYGAVMQDFLCVLEEAELDEFRPEGDDEVALQSLEAAATRLAELGDCPESASAPQVMERICRVREKPVQLPAAEE